MKLEFVNHSSFIVEHKGMRMICDPWIEGRVFDNGWDLIVKTPFTYEDYKNITHIWFSHEHPDHFFPPNIKNIPSEYRRNIIVYFQKTEDKRVVDFCRKMGFKEVIELVPNQWQPVVSDVKIQCENYTEGDSWIAFQSDEMTILNTNDCEINNIPDAKSILKKIGGKVDILLAQFSYACWAGNVADTQLRKEIAKSKMDIFLLQTNEFKPKVAIPTASYVWFCHQENFYLNAEVNTPKTVLEVTSQIKNTETVILYPGEHYYLGKKHDTENSVKMWENAYNRVLSTPFDQLEKPHSISEEVIKKEAETFAQQMNKDFGWMTKLLKPTFVYLSDLKKSYKLSVPDGLVDSATPQENCDISLSSDSLFFCIKFPYGNDTLGVNGRFQKPENGNYTRYYNMFRFNQLKSRGIPVGIGYLAGAIWRKVTGSN